MAVNQEPGWAVMGGGGGAVSLQLRWAGPPRERKCGRTGEDSGEKLGAGRRSQASPPPPPPTRQEEEKGFGEGRLRTGAPARPTKSWGRGRAAGKELGGAGAREELRRDRLMRGNERRFDVCAAPPRLPCGVRGWGGRPRRGAFVCEAGAARAVECLPWAGWAWPPPSLGPGEPGVRVLAEPQNPIRWPCFSCSPAPDPPSACVEGTWKPEERAWGPDPGSGGEKVAAEASAG